MRNQQAHGPFRLTLNVSDRVILDNYMFIHVHDSSSSVSPFSLINAREGKRRVNYVRKIFKRERSKERGALHLLRITWGYLCERKNERERVFYRGVAL